MVGPKSKDVRLYRKDKRTYREDKDEVRDWSVVFTSEGTMGIARSNQKLGRGK